MTQNCCASCAFGRVGIDGKDRQIIICHRYPPAGHPQRWPALRPDDWCGEHEPGSR